MSTPEFITKRGEMFALTKNQRGRFDKKLKAHGFTSNARKAILETLQRDMQIHGLRATDVDLGHYEIDDNGHAIAPCDDMDNFESLLVFTNKCSTDNSYTGFPILMIRSR